MISKFEECCTPKKNVTYEQGATETVDAYVTELRKLAKICEFGDFLDSVFDLCSCRLWH